jgi:RHS repeat-associated protein
VRHTILSVEQLESRDLPNAAPTIGSLLFDKPVPQTNDTVHVQLVDVADPDGDPLVFHYDWRVNGTTVRLHTTSATSDALDLSQSGQGDRGDVIELIVTASDGTASTSLAAALTVAAAPIFDTTLYWLTGFEDEPLGSVTVVVFETVEPDVLDWTARIDWGDGTTTTGQIVADGDGRFRVVGEHTYDDWGLYLVQVTLTDTAEATHDLYNLANIQFRSYTYTFTDPLGNSTQFVFAEGWRLMQEIDPLGHSTFYSYTSDGLLASCTDRLGRTILFDYNSDGWLVSQTWLAADGLTVVDTLSYSYSSDGLLQSASNGIGTYTFSWTDGMLTGVTNPFGVTLTFGYDSDGRRTSVADSFGGLITSTYSDGLLSSRTLTAGALHLRVDLGYDRDSRLSQISRFAGPLQELVSQTEYAFAQGLLASITHRGAGGVILDQFLYQFDADGFLSRISSNFAGETDYSYDADGQLTGEWSPLMSNTFRYDANGNRVGGGYVVGPGNRLLADGTWSYSYDAEGNLVGKTHLVTGDSWSYSYDHRNQMTLAEKRDATGAVVLRAAYKYDVFGNRIEKAVDWDGDGPNAPVVRRYVLDGWNNSKPTPVGNEHFDVYAELDGSNQLIARYLHGDEFDQTFARVTYEPTSPEVGSNPTVHWLLTDHLNSVRLVLDESGAVLDQIAYDAFGNIVAQLNPTTNIAGSLGLAGSLPILFASREFDAETGLYYNRARYLDPFTGRWTTQDPLGFAAGDANLYRYVGNMATMATDPSGNIAFLAAMPLAWKIVVGLCAASTAATAGYTAVESYRSTGSVFNGQIWGEYGDGLRIGVQANVNAIPTAARSLVTLGIWAEPWEVWAVDDADRPFYDNGFMFARFGWELLPTAGIGKLTQAPGQIGRWGRHALYWDATQNTVQVGRGGYDIYDNGLNWNNGLQVGGALLGLGGNYTTWRNLPRQTPRGVPLRGNLIGSVDNLSAAERRIVEYLLAEGRTVEIIPRGANRTPDFRVDGIPTELKTISGVANQTSDGLSAAMASRIMDGRGQASHILVDVRGQAGMTREIAERGVRRAFGADSASGSKIQSIRVIGVGFDITVHRVP